MEKQQDRLVEDESKESWNPRCNGAWKAHFSLILGMFLTLSLALVTTVSAEELSQVMTPAGWKPLPETTDDPTENPSVLLALRHPRHAFINWNMTTAPGMLFADYSKSQRKKLVERDFEKIGVKPREVLIVSNQANHFSVIVEYNQQRIPFIGGLVIAKDEKKNRTLFGTFVGPDGTRLEIQRLLDKQSDEVQAFFLSQKQEEPSPAVVEPKSDFLIGLFITVVSLLVLLFGIFGWKLLKPNS